jgi:hypothetical protein
MSDPINDHLVSRDPDGGDHEHHQRKVRKMVMAVTISMVLIVGAWLILLPSQLGSFSFFSSDEVTAWRDSKMEAGTEISDFKRRFESFKGRYEAAIEPTLSEHDETDIENAVMTESVVDVLRKKLEERNSETDEGEL